MVNVLTYCRVSSDEQAQKDLSIPAQRKALQRWIDERDEFARSSVEKSNKSDEVFNERTLKRRLEAKRRLHIRESCRWVRGIRKLLRFFSKQDDRVLALRDSDRHRPARATIAAKVFKSKHAATTACKQVRVHARNCLERPAIHGLRERKQRKRFALRDLPHRRRTREHLLKRGGRICARWFDG